MRNREINNDINITEFTAKLKNADDKYANLSKRFQIIYGILVPIYMLMIVAHIIDGSPWEDIVGSACYMFAMLIFALMFRYYHKQYRYVDYSQPTLMMLKKAAYRYKPFQFKLVWLILAMVFVDVALVLNTSLGFDFMWIQIFFIGSMIIAITIGLLIWRVKYKPLRDAALSLILEITGE